MGECLPCWRERMDAEDLEAFQKAKRITEYEGPLYVERIGDDDGDGGFYFRDLSHLVDYYISAGLPLPGYAWTCIARPSCFLDLDDILEQASEGAHEDFCADFDLTGTEELRKAIEAFNELNASEVTWEPDSSVAFILPEEVSHLTK